jgi:beta-phosphoglucomutase-like phosphatase (HAD superfamily)
MTQEAHAFLAGRTRPLRLVVFDCDGVLIDSESLCDRVTAASLTKLGWTISAEECHRRFIGLSFYDMVPLIESHIGRAIGTAWVDSMVAHLSVVLAEEVEPIPGAWDALTGTTALGLPWRIASNSSHTEMAAKFTRVGWNDLVRGRIHSAAEIIARGGRGKPAPDVFLEAAAAEGVDAACCLVIEDSVAGVTAAQAAGMACLGFSPDNDGAALRAAGAMPFRTMHAIPTLLRAAP